MIECTSRPLHTRLALLGSLVGLIVAAVFIIASIYHDTLVATIALLEFIAASTSLAAIICLSPGRSTLACLIGIIYPLAGIAAYIKARKSVGEASDVCKVFSALSVVLSLFTPLAVYYCLASLHQAQDKNGGRGV